MEDIDRNPKRDFFEPFYGWNPAKIAQLVATLNYAKGMNAYGQDFMVPLLAATENFAKVEEVRFWERPFHENFQAYSELLSFNYNLLSKYNQGILETLGQYGSHELGRLLSAWHATIFATEGEKLEDYFASQDRMLRRVLEEYPEAIARIEPEYGFHFERHPKSLIAETDRFFLRQVNPSEEGVETDNGMKPIIIVPPFVLGANILSFLPKEQKSYAHCFANKGIPTYIRIMKDIDATIAVQTMSLEDDARDTKYFCEQIKARHGRKVTLNGYCQGGFSSVCNILSGKLDGLVDALITCVAPMDGTRSTGLGNFLRQLPDQFNDLVYGSKMLASGNKVASGDLMGWVYKLKSMDDSGPLVAFVRDIMMLKEKPGSRSSINKTVLALNYWLQNERSDLPLSVTELSYLSYNNPVAEDGTLPITMFGEKLNFHAMKEKNIQWLICYGEQDDLVEKEVALAPLDFIDVEVTPFPKGHVAIATSWSHPESGCALDTVFGEQSYRGPVLFHLEITEDDGSVA
ncbi:MAG: metal transporter [Desulforhopalus sp.]|nr:metal transporter [Desulforhopalus sp.]